MGASPYWYFVDFEEDVQSALEKLKDREFRAGRYNPVIDMPSFPVDENSPAPGAGHKSIDEALEDADADGTRSILDLDHVNDQPYESGREDFGGVSPLGDDMLEEFFGSTKPSRDQVEEYLFDAIEEVERGTGIYIILYEGDDPVGITFAGYSYD